MACFIRKYSSFNQTLIPNHPLQSLSYTTNILFQTSNFSTTTSSSCHTSSNIKQKSSSLTDLLVSCGIKPNSQNQISTLSYFKSFGFSDTQIKSIISKNPNLLLCNVYQLYPPKIDFLLSIGLSQQDVIRIVSTDPRILNTSLCNHLIPSFDLLKRYYGGKEVVTDRIRRKTGLLRCRIIKCLTPNVETLREFGVPEDKVFKMVSGLSCCILCANTNPDRFRKAVASVMDMGFDPLSSSSFEQALFAMAWQSEESWLKKFKLYRSFGFSEVEIHQMFKKQPNSLSISEKKIREAVNFYFEKLNWSPKHVVDTPNALLYNLDKRVVPRCSVLQVLVSRKKAKKVKIMTILPKTEDDFLMKYINSYKDEVPEVLDAYQGKIKFDQFNCLL